jgi:hypothetical protein
VAAWATSRIAWLSTEEIAEGFDEWAGDMVKGWLLQVTGLNDLLELARHRRPESGQPSNSCRP